jgi:hypothetical protein
MIINPNSFNNLVFVFYVLLTALHLGIIPVNDQLDAQFFFYMFYFSSLHVSSNLVLISSRPAY